MFGRTVLGVDGDLFEHALDQAKKAQGTTQDLDLDEQDLQALVDRFKAIVQEHTGEPFPHGPRAPMAPGTRAAFESWNGECAPRCGRQ